MFVTRLTFFVAISLTISLLAGAPISADIYRFMDKNGVWHFTNINTDMRYRLYISTTSKKPLQYIRDYDGIIKQASRRFGVEPSLIKAVIKAESDFDHEAVSHKGAQGLMQLMPQTADEMAVESPFNPEENIFGGTRYLSLLLKRFKNNKTLALAAYNAGPQRVESCQGVPPISETKTFVKRVLAYYKSYNARAK